MTSLAAGCYIILLAITLISPALCDCTCSMKTTDFEYTRTYRNRLRTNLLHPRICVAAVDPILHHSEHLSASAEGPCCCRGLWTSRRLMLDDGESYMPTAYYCHRIPCPSQK